MELGELAKDEFKDVFGPHQLFREEHTGIEEAPDISADDPANIRS